MPPRMYPARFLDPRPNRHAEECVYNALAKAELPEGCIVIHDVAWVGLHSESRPSFLQVDFVIIAPELGVLVLEVKGGKRIWCKQKIWSVERHDGEIKEYKEAPHEQASRGMWALKELLDNRSNNTFPSYSVAYAICFPDHIVQVEDLDACLDRELVIDQADLDNLPRALKRVVDYWCQRGALRNRKGIVMAAKWVTFVQHQIARDYDLRRLLGPTLLAERRDSWKMAELCASAFFSDEQAIVLDRSERVQRLGIAGCAGSGKTLLAMAIARKLAARNKCVLFCCFNWRLHEEVARLMRDERKHIRVATFGEIRDDIVAPEVNFNSQAYPVDERTPRLLPFLREHLVWNGPRYQAIIVDEGQDFDRDWWNVLEHLLDDNAFLFVFFDDNQRLYPRRPGLPSDVQILPLTRNFRTTKAIHELIVQFYNGETLPTAVGSEGIQPWFMPYSGSSDHLAQQLRKILRGLRERQVRDEDIVILSPRNNASLLQEIGVELGLTDDPKKPGIFWTSIYQFKGLERPVVLLVELDPEIIDRPECDQLLYVGYSRASQVLGIVHHADVSEARLQVQLTQLQHANSQQFTELNPEQRSAVLAPPSIQQIRAGAGTGKTRVLIRRIEHLIGYYQIDPQAIMAVTFTVKAAQEIRERLRLLFGASAARRITVGTFHSICARILREEIPRLEPPRFVGRNRSFEIAGTNTRKVLREILDGYNRRRSRKNQIDIDDIEVFISKNKEEGLTPEEVPVHSSKDLVLRNCYQAYEQHLRNSNIVDFDDLLNLTVRLLKYHPMALQRVRNRYRHILVDEFQDTNGVQFQLIRLLTLGNPPQSQLERGRSLLVVGDAQQAIYSWRGARYELFRDFPDHFPGTTRYDLVRNYRSSRRIIEVALALAGPSITGVDRLELLAARSDADNAPIVSVIEPESIEAEAREIVERIRIAIDSGKVEARSVAILIRAQRGSVAAVETTKAITGALRGAKIPFVGRGLETFYGNPVINALVEYLRALLRPQDDTLLRAALLTNFFRHIGEGIVQGLIEKRQQLGYDTLWDLLNARKQGRLFELEEPIALDTLSVPNLGWQRAQTIREGIETMHRLRERLRQSPDFEYFMRYVSTETKLRERYLTERNAEQFDSLIEVFISLITHEMESIADLFSVLNAFAAYNNLFEDADVDANPGGRVNVMSIHSAKGLEFDIVFVPGLEEGMFPSDLDMRSRDELLEAGRLCYVAFTRPREELVLSCVRTRDPLRPRQPSPFLQAVREVIDAREALATLQMQSGFVVRVHDSRTPKAKQEDTRCGGVVIDSIDHPLSAEEWASIERFAGAHPGEASIYILMYDEHEQIVEEDTGVMICGQMRIVHMLRTLLGRPIYSLPFQENSTEPVAEL